MTFSPITYKIDEYSHKQTGIFELDFTRELELYGITPFSPDRLPFSPTTNRISRETRRKSYRIKNEDTNISKFF